MNPPRHTESKGFSAELLVRRALSMLSRPLVDRLDLQIWLPPVPVKELLVSRTAPLGNRVGEGMKKRVLTARRIQQERSEAQAKLNSRLTPGEITKYCMITPQGKALLERASSQLGLTARGINRVLKVSRTIADLDECEQINPPHLAEALSYRLEERDK